MKPLIPEIEIGKRYRIRVRPAEGNTCPHCGHEAGTDTAGQEYMATVLSRFQRGKVLCLHCETIHELSLEGRYVVRTDDGDRWVVPYTDFLEVIE